MAGINAILAPLFEFYNTLFQPLLAAGPYVSLGFFSVLLAALFSVIYWWLLDIEKADRIKEKIDKYQERMKEAREEDEQEKASSHFKKTLQLNQKFMMLNMKPMIATMVFVGLFFPWLGATYAPTVEMTQINDTAYNGTLEYANQEAALEALNVSGQMQFRGEGALSTDELEALGLTWEVTNFRLVEDQTHDAEMKINGKFIDLPVSIPLAGEALNWLGFYILIIMPMTYIFRKLLGVQ
ncbi:EMC3/TMCO1 family protein [Candidatus Nanosalina sp. VS9-1]|uniref:EMC3/TMCO1 family protein n=1 Tax=Candidatus Nanosalina sp. VS9-1 TaxID=3388566 RepID=UPI0039DFE297